jgi:ribosomal protein S18 acetylase RimI-like enzyme
MNSMSDEAEAIVRLLSKHDAHVFDRIDNDVFDNPVRADLVTNYLQDESNLLAVAVQDDTVVGMASAILYIHPDKPLQMFINEVGVAGRCQGRGIGRKLMNLLLDHGREIGCIEAWVATEEDNAAARALYAAVQGREDPALAVVYTWHLSPVPVLPHDTERND